MPKTKEEISAYHKAYNQSAFGKKSARISQWKTGGIIVDDDDWGYFYDYVLSVTHCQQCNKELTSGQRHTTHSTRCVDHDHAIIGRPNVRMICCNNCNVIDKSNNTSGEPNVIYHKTNDTWVFSKNIEGKRYRKAGFKTKQSAIDYKLNFLLKFRIEPPNDGLCHKIQ